MENFPYEFYHKCIGMALSRNKKYRLVIKYFTGTGTQRRTGGSHFRVFRHFTLLDFRYGDVQGYGISANENHRTTQWEKVDKEFQCGRRLKFMFNLHLNSKQLIYLSTM